MKFLVPNYSCLQNPWLGGYRSQIPIVSVLCPQLNMLNPPPPEKNSWVRHWLWYRLWCIAYWIPKATDTQSYNVILIAFPLQQWLRERALFILYTCISCLVIYECYRKRTMFTFRSTECPFYRVCERGNSSSTKATFASHGQSAFP
jgi:hypothetical protein